MGAGLRILVMACLVAGCSLFAEGRPELGISNGTGLVVTLTVNGLPVGVFPPIGPSPDIDETVLPALPWRVEARTSTGRVLVSMLVAPGSVTTEVHADGRTSSSSVAGRIDLSCGRLDIWAGKPPIGPPPGPGVPGDCEP